MTEKEKELIKMYIANQGLRFDSDVEFLLGQVYRDRSPSVCAALLRAINARESFNKFAHDLSALLNL